MIREPYLTRYNKSKDDYVNKLNEEERKLDGSFSEYIREDQRMNAKRICTEVFQLLKKHLKCIYIQMCVMVHKLLLTSCL